MDTRDIKPLTAQAGPEGAQPRPGSLEHWGAIRPSETAVVEGSLQWTWQEWNALADRLATALAERGLRAGDVIAIRSRVRFEWCLADVAAAKLGCTLLCLNWHLTAPETAYILANAGARAIVCDDEHPEALAEAWDSRSMIAVSIDRPAEGFVDWRDLLATEPRPWWSAAEPRLMIYTSGTTGLPKGVLGGQTNGAPPQVRAEYLHDRMAHGNQQPGDVVLVSVPLHHGLGSGMIHRAIEFGNRLILMRRYEPEAALKAIQAHRVTYWFAVPTMFKRMAALPLATLAKYDGSSIRSIMTGTAPVSMDVKRWVIQHFGACLTEAYGSTETSLITYLSAPEQLTRPGSSGRPYRHVKIKIVDAEGRELGPGQTGEILARTPVAIRGYVGCEPLKEDVLDADGFFRVGDAGHLDADGYLYITDRVKDMIISGGVNIYPAEIEAVLLSHPGVADAAVIGIPNDEYGEEVIGFFEPKPGVTPSEEELLSFCGASLASYKRPRRLTAVAELPRNTMGKVVKQQLRAPFWAGRERLV